MALTEAQIEHFYREGYVVAPALVPHASIQAVLSAAPEGITTGERWRPSIFDHENPLQDAKLHRLLIEPNVVEAVTDIFGTPPRVYYGMLAVVPARGGQGLPWHQDNQYDQILGGALNVFIALCDITPDKAMLWVAPRSHRAGVQPSKANETNAPGHREAIVEPDNGILLSAMQACDACIFDRSTYHRTLQNETDEPRFAYAAQYQTEHARRAETGAKNPIKMRAADLERRWLEGGALD